jgi:hypothetical protein
MLVTPAGTVKVPDVVKVCDPGCPIASPAINKNPTARARGSKVLSKTCFIKFLFLRCLQKNASNPAKEDPSEFAVDN